MTDQLTSASPPGYGAVNAPSYPPPGGAPGVEPSGMAPPTEAPPAYSAPYPQPGTGQAGSGPYPTEPPPKYEPQKGQMGPPQGPPMMVPGGYAAQPGYQVGGVSQSIIVSQPMGWGPVPRTTECPNCRALITSSLNYRPGGLAWLASGLICLFGCWAGCCLIPFCLPDLQDVEHTCPNCEASLGTYHRL